MSKLVEELVQRATAKGVVELVPVPKITVEDKQDRGKLSEGRNYQMGFAFCKKVEPGKFETVQPLSPCKDYLNDVIYSELTGKPINACGLSYSKQGIFDCNISFLAIKIMQRKGGGYSTGNFDTDRENLKKNAANIVNVLHLVEGSLDVVGRSAIVQASNDPDLFLLYVPYWWCRSTHLISLYSLIVRIAQFWDGTGKSEDFLKTYQNPLDKNLWNPDRSYGGTGALQKWEKMMKFGVRVISPEEMTYGVQGDHSFVHSAGILQY